MVLQTAYVWEKGGNREKNQDSLSLQQVRVGRQPIVLAAVCDGIGGLAEGETASGSVAEALTDWFYRTFLIRSRQAERRYGRALAFPASIGWLKKSLSRCLYRTASRLARYKADEDLGSTCTAVLVWGKWYLAVHVGDSQAYLLAQTRARMLTRAETDETGALCNAVGSFSLAKPQFYAGRLKQGQGLLLATDGFYRYFSGRQLAQRLYTQEETEAMLQKRLRRMVQQARDRGSRDDCTAVCIFRRKGA